uniref:HNH endonuclease signature motif containing protein n=1 Tax=Pedobacter schmidteae TaxID=2201271 RepID=UPI000EB441B5|nr:HNH endonuclease signature motif containing protein [Pedobacter schmidteae]
MNLFDLKDDICCTYKEEVYSVRENGMVYRHSKLGGRARKYDNLWTFGKVNINTGYLEIASATIHRIIATAFHGTPPTPQHVVDHIDTNRQNNRPSNLRWVTKLENILLNPITARRIAIVCGSVEEFLEEPSKFKGLFRDPNYDWMGAVSEDEAMDCRERLSAWAKSEKFPIGGSLDAWIFTRYTSYGEPIEKAPILIQAITPNALQREWQTPSEFPCCPQEYTGEPIQAYSQRLTEDAVFCVNDLYSSVVYKSVVINDGQSIYVMTHNEEGMKGWALAEVTFEDGMFVHTSKGTFFEEKGAEKQYCLAQGLEWTGGDGVDDYC